MDRLEARKRLGLNREQKILLFVGNLYPVKGVSYLLEAFFPDPPRKPGHSSVFDRGRAFAPGLKNRRKNRD